jgi:multiple sugar transport system substrate-binding protein
MSKKISLTALSFLVIAALVLSGCGCKNSATNYEVRLEVWGLFDDSDVMAKAINAYQKRNPRVREINYKKLTVDSYENDLLEALATGNGPDVFLIHNTWLPKHNDKLAAVPLDNLSSQSSEILNVRQVKEQFVDVVSSDFVSGEKIYALPLSADSLGLYFNRDLLNQAGISQPPQTWAEFDEAVKKMTKVDSFGNITLSGAAIGISSDASPGGGKVNRATDILTLIMMQAGTEITDKETGVATFADFTIQNKSGNQILPGEAAVAYYTKFSNPYNAEYCWNSAQHNSIDAFIEGKAAITLNYSWLIPKIEAKAPKLNLGIAPIPQNKDKEDQGIDVNFANYWGFAVSKNKVASQENVQKAKDSRRSFATNEQRVAEAWKFVRFLAMAPAFSANLPVGPTSDLQKYDPAAEYVAGQKKPAARRDLIAAQKSDSWLGPFAEGNLIAKSWPQPDNLAVEKIFDEMIDDVVLRNAKLNEVLRQAQNEVNLLMRK